MEANLQASKPSSPYETKDASELRALLDERDQELAERKRFDEEAYSLIYLLEKRVTESAVQLVTARQEMMLEKQRQLECQLEIAHLTDILVREQDALTVVSQELESFNYGISHDLRAPLRHIVGFATVLLEDYYDRLDSTAQGYLGSIKKAGGKMESQIEALLALSRISRQELRATTVDLGKIARDCALSLQESAPERKVDFTVSDQLSAQADPSMIRAAIWHLVANAWKYTGKKERGSVEFGCKQERGCIIYYLCDNGAGFDMRYADRLFAPFQRMHHESEFEGTGVGLATVQRIIHRHGGKIWADAEPGVGATFYFTLCS